MNVYQKRRERLDLNVVYSGEGALKKQEATRCVAYPKLKIIGKWLAVGQLEGAALNYPQITPD